jgi:hypothetical protein
MVCQAGVALGILDDAALSDLGVQFDGWADQTHRVPRFARVLGSIGGIGGRQRPPRRDRFEGSGGRQQYRHRDWCSGFDARWKCLGFDARHGWRSFAGACGSALERHRRRQRDTTARRDSELPQDAVRQCEQPNNQQPRAKSSHGAVGLSLRLGGAIGCRN